MHFNRLMRQVRPWVALVTAALGGCQSTEPNSTSPANSGI